MNALQLLHFSNSMKYYAVDSTLSVLDTSRNDGIVLTHQTMNMKKTMVCMMNAHKYGRLCLKGRILENPVVCA